MLSALRFLFLLVSVLAFTTAPQAQTLSINEVMASNATTLPDDDGDYEDWIELHNYGNEAISLTGYGLSDAFNQPFRWVFPNLSIQPGAYLLIWASGKDRRQPAAPLHTNFSISASGEEIILTHPQGFLVDALSPTAIPTDYSYGRVPNGIGDWRYFTQPTPGEPNTGQGYALLLDSVKFSHAGGAFDTAFNLVLSHSHPEAMVVYSLDGAEPDEHHHSYDQPILIRDRVGEPNTISMIPTNFLDVGPPYYEGWQPPEGEVFKINVVRARALHPEAPPGPVVTQAYLIHETAENRYSLPWLSIATKPENLFDDDIGIYVPGNHNNYFQSGDEWERPANLIFFEANGDQAFNENMGLRLHGNTSRSRPRKSLRINFRAQYGNSWLHYPLFESKTNEVYKRFILRNSGNDWGLSIIRDAFIQTLAADLHVETQHYQPAVLFINGEYWGIHNMRDRYNKHHFEAHYGLAENEITVMENNARFKFGNTAGTAHYHSMYNFVAANNMAVNALFGTAETMMDMESFTDFQFTHIFSMNTDWPGNNVLYWRHLRDGYSPESGVRDGRWRWMMLDTDFGFGLDLFYVPGHEQGAAHNTLAMAMAPDGPGWPNPPWSTQLLRELLENQNYRHYFINRFADLLNTTFSAVHVGAVLDSIRDLLEPEMQEHIHRWRSPAEMGDWLTEIQRMRNFAQQRPTYMRNHIRQSFGLSGTLKVKLRVDPPEAGTIRINTITPAMTESWEGIYFNGIPVELKAEPAPGYRFVAWEGDAGGLSAYVTLTPENDIEAIALFEQSNDFPGDEMNPPAYRLLNGPYQFMYWGPDHPEGSFPPHMIFQQSRKNDPGLTDEMTDPYHIPAQEYHEDDMDNIGFPYRLNHRTRINGLGDGGISLINTGRGRDLGAVVLALDTRHLEDIMLSWTGGTMQANSRAYALRLQYRIGHESFFTDVLDSLGMPVEYYRSGESGHLQSFEDILLPAELNNQPYVQLRWKYYFTGQQLDPASGERDALGLSNISVRTRAMHTVEETLGEKPALLLHQNRPNPAREHTTITYELKNSGLVQLEVVNAMGKPVSRLVNDLQTRGMHQITFQAGAHQAGLYLIKLTQNGQTAYRKMLIIK